MQCEKILQLHCETIILMIHYFFFFNESCHRCRWSDNYTNINDKILFRNWHFNKWLFPQGFISNLFFYLPLCETKRCKIKTEKLLDILVSPDLARNPLNQIEIIYLYCCINFWKPCLHQRKWVASGLEIETWLKNFW